MNSLCPQTDASLCWIKQTYYLKVRDSSWTERWDRSLDSLLSVWSPVTPLKGYSCSSHSCRATLKLCKYKHFRTFKHSHVQIIKRKNSQTPNLKVKQQIMSVELFDFLFRCGNPQSDAPTLTQARHRAHLQQCTAALAQYQRYRDIDLALAAEGIRLALTSLGRITGKVGAEEILDIIFKDFCIGK